MNADQGVDENSKMDSQPSDKEDAKPSSQGATPKAKQSAVSCDWTCLRVLGAAKYHHR